MQKRTIGCAFCQGTGSHPHFSGTCPVCKGKGQNTVKGAYVVCQDCNGSGRKLGTSLTCYSCGGIGQVVDRRAIVAQAAREIKKARAEMEKEKAELRGRTAAKSKTLPHRKKVSKTSKRDTYFCQSCGDRKHQETFKICQSCFSILKEEVLKRGGV